MEKGALILTSINSKSPERNNLSIIKEFDFKNPLGNLVLAKVEKRDYFLLAGPNRGPDLEQTLSSLSLEKGLTVLVDGAINRLVPLSLANEIILSIGASYSTNLEYLAKTAAALYDLFSLSEKDKETEKRCLVYQPYITFVDEQGKKQVPYTSLFATNVFKRIKNEARGKISELLVPGIVTSSLFTELKGLMREGGKIRFKNPLVLLATNNAVYWNEAFKQHRVEVSFFQSPKLRAFTINPFYPYYASGKFQPRYLQAEEMMEVIKNASPLPVFDVVKFPQINITDLYF